MPPVLHEERNLPHGLAPSRQTQRHGTLPLHTPQRVRHERHDDVIALRPRVFETLHQCWLAQTLSLVGVPLLPVDRIPGDGVRQQNVCEDRCQPPKILTPIPTFSSLQ